MAETSGFATDLPQSAYLALTIQRAISAAEQRSHRYVTLEHLLFALLDDPDASAVLEGARADMPALRRAATETVNHNLATLYTPGQFDLHASYKVERVLQSASDDARRMGCAEVDGAFVAVALFEETDSTAYDLLRRSNFVFHAANRWLKQNRCPPAPASAPESHDGAPQGEASREQDDEMLLDDVVEAEAWEGQPRAAPHPHGAGQQDEEQDSAGMHSDAARTDRDATPPPREPRSVPQRISHERERHADHGWQDTDRLSIALESDAPPGGVPHLPMPRGVGAPASERDQPAPGHAIEPTEHRPSRHHASARERSTVVDRPPASPPAPTDLTAPPANGELKSAKSAGLGEVRPAMPARAEPQLPPLRRLEDMRLRSGGSREVPPAPARTQTRKTAAARDKDKGGRARRRPQSAEAVYAGKLAENIPRKMRAFKTQRVEVRVSREETEPFLAGFEGGAEVFRHDLTVTQAMSVMLRAPDGGFTIESLGPETQWIFSRPGPGEKEPFGRWSWSVTPTEPGKRRLQLVVSARSVDQNGLAGDTALPDQVITVQVGTNFLRNAGQAIRWVFLMALGGVITEGALIVMRLLAK